MHPFPSVARFTAGAYAAVAIVTGFASPPAGAEDVLYVSGSAAPTSISEKRSILQLQLLGHDVTVVDDNIATVDDAIGKDFVYISANVSSNKVEDEFALIAMPVVVVEGFVLDDMGLTGTTRDVDYGTTADQTELDMVGSNPLTSGLTGTIPMTADPEGIMWGLPGPAAIVAATEAGVPGHGAIFGYESGAAMVSGNAPARRVALPLADTVVRSWTTDMVQLFDTAVAWAISAPAPNRLRIQPLGDSITQGVAGFKSYRSALWPLLQAEGCEVDFIGAQHIDPGTPAFDGDHEGHSGFRTDEVEAELTTWLIGNVPELVLLHLGTNDVLQNVLTSVAGQNLRDVIGLLRAANPSVTVLLAQIIPARIIDEPGVLSLNAEIAIIAGDLDAPASPVVLVDQYTGYDGTILNHTDNIHPNALGEARIAEVWTDALLPQLGAETCTNLTAVPSGSDGSRVAVALTLLSIAWAFRSRRAASRIEGDISGD